MPEPVKQTVSSSRQTARQNALAGDLSPSAGPDGAAFAPPAYGLERPDSGSQGSVAFAQLRPGLGRAKPFTHRRILPRASFPIAQRVIQRAQGDKHAGVIAKKPDSQTLAIKVTGAGVEWFDIPGGQVLTEGQQVEFTEGAGRAVTGLSIITPVSSVPVTGSPASALPVPKTGASATPGVGGPQAVEVKSSTPTKTFGAEMADLSKTELGGKYQYHYGRNTQHKEAKMRFGSLGIRAEAISKYGGTTGEFTFKSSLFKDSGGYDEHMKLFDRYFNESIIASEKTKARYAGAVENKAAGKVTKRFASREHSALAPAVMGRRFSKASLVYAALRGGHIHFHLEGLGDASAIAQIIGKKGEQADRVTSSELRFVHRFWNRGLNFFLPRNFWTALPDSSDDEADGPTELVENKSFKGFKDHTTFYRQAGDKIVTVPPPW